MYTINTQGYASGAMIISIAPSPLKRGIGVTGRRPDPGLNPPRGDVAPNLPTLSGTLALQDGEEVRWPTLTLSTSVMESLGPGLKVQVASSSRSLNLGVELTQR